VSGAGEPIALPAGSARRFDHECEIPDVDALSSRLSVNGEQRQSANLKDMIVPIAEAIELVSSVVDIRPGDVLATGTREGVGPVTVGDRVAIEIDAVGGMMLEVVAAEPAPRPF
jgi:2-keto-4-pentenoate hydratase/2-oxohepta-3-ene-1,7-dioic acid hydratase in catechol pathway